MLLNVTLLLGLTAPGLTAPTNDTPINIGILCPNSSYVDFILILIYCKNKLTGIHRGHIFGSAAADLLIKSN